MMMYNAVAPGARERQKQCVAACLKCVAVCCSALHEAQKRWKQCVALCLQCVAVCCGVLHEAQERDRNSVLQCGCSVLQCDAMRCMRRKREPEN